MHGNSSLKNRDKTSSVSTENMAAPIRVASRDGGGTNRLYALKNRQDHEILSLA